MTPLEAMCRAYCTQGGFDPDERMPNDGPRWKYYVPGMLAALNALADNVSAKMHQADIEADNCNMTKQSLAAAIRAAGEG